MSRYNRTRVTYLTRKCQVTDGSLLQQVEKLHEQLFAFFEAYSSLIQKQVKFMAVYYNLAKETRKNR